MAALFALRPQPRPGAVPQLTFAQPVDSAGLATAMAAACLLQDRTFQES